MPAREKEGSPQIGHIFRGGSGFKRLGFFISIRILIVHFPSADLPLHVTDKTWTFSVRSVCGSVLLSSEPGLVCKFLGVKHRGDPQVCRLLPGLFKTLTRYDNVQLIRVTMTSKQINFACCYRASVLSTQSLSRRHLH